MYCIIILRFLVWSSVLHSNKLYQEPKYVIIVIHLREISFRCFLYTITPVPNLWTARISNLQPSNSPFQFLSWTIKKLGWKCPRVHWVRGSSVHIVSIFSISKTYSLCSILFGFGNDRGLIKKDLVSF